MNKVSERPLLPKGSQAYRREDTEKNVFKSEGEWLFGLLKRSGSNFRTRVEESLPTSTSAEIASVLTSLYNIPNDQRRMLSGVFNKP